MSVQVLAEPKKHSTALFTNPYVSQTALNCSLIRKKTFSRPEHFQTLFSATNEISDDTTNRIPQRPIETEFDVNLSTKEMINALNKYQN